MMEQAPTLVKAPKLVFITGGNSGIGFEAVKLLVSKSYGSCRVVLACRDQEKVRMQSLFAWCISLICIRLRKP